MACSVIWDSVTACLVSEAALHITKGAACCLSSQGCALLLRLAWCGISYTLCAVCAGLCSFLLETALLFVLQFGCAVLAWPRLWGVTSACRNTSRSGETVSLLCAPLSSTRVTCVARCLPVLLFLFAVLHAHCLHLPLLALTAAGSDDWFKDASNTCRHMQATAHALCCWLCVSQSHVCFFWPGLF
jgi:hypothetical protein